MLRLQSGSTLRRLTEEEAESLSPGHISPMPELELVTGHQAINSSRDERFFMHVLVLDADPPGLSPTGLRTQSVRAADEVHNVFTINVWKELCADAGGAGKWIRGNQLLLGQAGSYRRQVSLWPNAMVVEAPTDWHFTHDPAAAVVLQ